jgi:hypothetical protein
LKQVRRLPTEGVARFAAEADDRLARRPDDPALQAAATLARWLDDRYLDPLLGLVPVVGDVLSAALGVYPIFLAWRRQAPRTLLARMLLNLAVDALGGAVPIVGDVWDFLFRAHSRNLALLENRQHGGQVTHRPADTLVVVAAGLALVVALAVPFLLLAVLVKWLRG